MTHNMDNKITIITGTFPPEKCGVGDFCFKLSENHTTFEIYHDTNWGIKTFFDKITAINQRNTLHLNIQYPSMGFGYSIVPHLLCLYFYVFSKKKISITFHEFKKLGRKSKLASLLMLLFSNRLIFTNEFELMSANAYCSIVKRKSRVIKIFSNITPAQNLPTIESRTEDVGYFGFISPQKGLEDFISVAESLFTINSNYQIYIMGQIQPEYLEYSKSIIEKASSVGIKLFLNESEEFVAKKLANTKLCYLPYPDGVSERRGSFLAAVLNNCLIHTTKGNNTTVGHESFCSFSDTENAAVLINEILQKPNSYFQEKMNATLRFIRTELPYSWDDVARQYIRFIIENK